MFKKICKVLVLSALIMQAGPSWAQAPDLEAKVNAAVQQMDAGLYDESEALLRDAIALDATNFNAWYELAYLQFTKKDYKTSMKTALNAAKLPDASEQAWQLAGNAADLMDKPLLAMELYKRGLRKFPNSGLLYMEMGIVAVNSRNYPEAMGYFEKGIDIDPTFPSNYYYATKILLLSSEPLWGILYGEVFMNLERNSNRTQEIGARLLSAYKAAVLIGEKDDESHSKSEFTKNHTVYADGMNLTIPFPIIFELVMENAMPSSVTDVNLETINQIRTNFISVFFYSKASTMRYQTYTNILFEYQRLLADAGHLEAYNYWVLSGGDAKAFHIWVNTYSEQWSAFMKWFVAHPFEQNKNNYFTRHQYDKIAKDFSKTK